MCLYILLESWTGLMVTVLLLSHTEGGNTVTGAFKEIQGAALLFQSGCILLQCNEEDGAALKVINERPSKGKGESSPKS